MEKICLHGFYESLSVQNREEQKLEKSLKENSETKRKDRPNNKHSNANEKSHTSLTHGFYKSLSVQNWEEHKLEKSLKENSEIKRKDIHDNEHFNTTKKSHTKTKRRQT